MKATLNTKRPDPTRARLLYLVERKCAIGMMIAVAEKQAATREAARDLINLLATERDSISALLDSNSAVKPTEKTFWEMSANKL